MGGEDFSYYLEKVPGAFILLGTGNPQKGTDAPHHSPRFDVDEEVLYMGSALLASIALNHHALWK
jgi:metal-dependent amidase/aminoacylase/carboxypeptidase family protein